MVEVEWPEVPSTLDVY